MFSPQRDHVSHPHKTGTKNYELQKNTTFLDSGHGAIPHRKKNIPPITSPECIRRCKDRKFGCLAVTCYNRHV